MNGPNTDLIYIGLLSRGYSARAIKMVFRAFETDMNGSRILGARGWETARQALSEDIIEALEQVGFNPREGIEKYSLTQLLRVQETMLRLGRACSYSELRDVVDSIPVPPDLRKRSWAGQAETQEPADANAA